MGHNVTEYLRQSGSKERKTRQRKRVAPKAVLPSALLSCGIMHCAMQGGCDDLGVPSDWTGHRREFTSFVRTDSVIKSLVQDSAAYDAGGRAAAPRSASRACLLSFRLMPDGSAC